MEHTTTDIQNRFRRNTLWQVVIRALLVALITLIGIWLFYQAALMQQRSRLSEIVENQASMIEVMARHMTNGTGQGSSHASAQRELLHQLHEASQIFPGIGKTGEFTLAKRENGNIVFLLRHRHSNMERPAPVPLNAKLAEPMRRALSGKKGNIEAPDYRGETVLAAYHFIDELGWGVVAKIDMDEVNAPYIQTGWIIVLLATLFTAGSAYYALRSVRPMMDALRQSEERYRLLVEEQNDLVISFDPNFQLTFVSHNYCETFGTSEEALLSKKFFPKIHTDDRESVRASLKRLFAPPYKTQHEERALTKDGWRWFQWSDQAITDEQGNVVEIIAVGRDITDYKNLEQERDESMQLLRQHAVVFETAVDAVFITDTNGRILSINDSFSLITGYSRDEAVGQTMRLLRSGRHDHDFYRSMFDELLAHGRWQGEIWNRRKNGEIFPVWETITRIEEDQGKASPEVRYIGIFTDISARKFEEERLNWLAYHDGLTELPNRLLFKERCEHALKRVKRSELQLAFLFIDLDGFKPVNDRLGHASGDILLQQTAIRLGSVIRQQDTLARLGGDEFAILLEDIQGVNDARVVATKILEVLSEPFDIEGEIVTVSGSVGIALYPIHGEDWETLIHKADSAMYQSKREGRGRYSISG